MPEESPITRNPAPDPPAQGIRKATPGYRGMGPTGAEGISPRPEEETILWHYGPDHPISKFLDKLGSHRTDIVSRMRKIEEGLSPDSQEDYRLNRITAQNLDLTLTYLSDALKETQFGGVKMRDGSTGKAYAYKEDYRF